MKAKSRKRLLISSVAMLLVAMLALGTATFAWFTTDTTVTAQGLNVRTTKASSLKLSNATTDWTGDGLNYGLTSSNDMLMPASSVDGTNWFKNTATAHDSYAASGNATALAFSGTDNYYTANLYKNQLNIKNDGEADLKDVYIKFQMTETLGNTTATGSNYVRFAICEAAGRAWDDNADTQSLKSNIESTNAANKSTGSTLTFADHIYGVGSNTGTEAYATASTTSAQTVIDASVTPAYTNNTATGGYIYVGNLPASAEKYYNIYVWFEGQDTDCKDDNAGNVLPNFNINVGGTTVNG